MLESNLSHASLQQVDCMARTPQAQSCEYAYADCPPGQWLVYLVLLPVAVLVMLKIYRCSVARHPQTASRQAQSMFLI